MNNHPPVSNANQWMACPGSFQAQQIHPGIPGEMSESRLEGRACHEMARRVLDGEVPESIVGTLSADGIVITQELADVTMVYVNDVRAIAGSGAKTEDRIPLDHIREGWYGICDAWYHDENTNTVYIWDFKAGHTFVPAFENWQLVMYAVGLYGFTWNDIYAFNLRIVQPRCYSGGNAVREWTLSPEQFDDVHARVVEGTRKATSDAPQCITGSQCKQCTARAHCETLQRVAYEGIDYTAELQTHGLSGHTLGVELKLLQRAARDIECRLSGLEAQALHEIQAGNDVAFYTVKHGKGRERWRKDVPTEQIIMMGEIMGVDARKPVELDTPAQLRNKGIDETVIKAYSETPSTGAKLVEVDVSHARNVFTNN